MGFDGVGVGVALGVGVGVVRGVAVGAGDAGGETRLPAAYIAIELCR
jgi:hypothetical protein